MSIEWNNYPKIDEDSWLMGEQRKDFRLATRCRYTILQPTNTGIIGFAQGGITSVYKPKFFGEVAKELGLDGEEFTPEKALIYSRYGLIKWGCNLDKDNLERVRIALNDKRSDEAIYKLSSEERLNPDILAETLLQVYRDILREF